MKTIWARLFEFAGRHVTHDEAWDMGWIPLKDSLDELRKQADLIAAADNQLSASSARLSANTQALGLLRDDVKRLEGERDAAVEDLKQEKADRLIKANRESLKAAKAGKATAARKKEVA